MSIQAYVGLPRSGKSYNAVANVILPALKQGRVVVTNIPLHMEEIVKLYPQADVREFPTQRIEQEPGLIFDYVPHGCVLVIDEVWRLFPAGLKVNRVPQEFKSLLAEHGHMVDEQGNAIAITLVTQDLGQIAAFAKQLVEQTFHHTKLAHLGTDGSFRVRIFHGPVTGQSPPKSQEINMVLGRYDESIYRLYQSHTMSRSATAGANEKAMDTRGVVWKRPGLIVAAIVCVVLIVWAGRTLGGVFSTGDEPAGSSVASTGPARPSFVASTTPRSTSTNVVSSTRSTAADVTWRVSGLIDLGEDSIALLAASDGRTAITSMRDCLRSRWNVRCKFRGEWVEFEPARIPVETVAASAASIVPPVPQ